VRIIDFEGKKRPAEYLGDAVYAIFDGYGIWLHTGSHDEPINKVYLEPGVVTALTNFLRQANTKEVYDRCHQ